MKNSIFNLLKIVNRDNLLKLEVGLYIFCAGIYLISIVAFKPKAEPKLENATVIKWLSFDQAIAASQKNKKKVFIDVYTDWCGWCKKMDAATFSNEKLAAYVNKNFYAVKLDAESMKTLEFRGKTLSERELAGQVFNVSAYPTTVYLDENFDILSPVPGYLDVPTFDKILKFYGENNYLKQSWKEFEESYKP